jgi:membrane-bound lytic murein transglycosylase B
MGVHIRHEYTFGCTYGVWVHILVDIWGMGTDIGGHMRYGY